MVTQLPVKAWEMELSRLFQVSADYLPGLKSEKAVYFEGLTKQEKQLLYSIPDYSRANVKRKTLISQKSSEAEASELLQ